MARRRETPIQNIKENQDDLINLANDLARKKLADGTASSPVITHFLQLGTEEHQYEQRRMQLKIEREELENELLRAKTENLRANTTQTKMYAEAIKAFGLYNGSEFDDDEEEDY